jgi:amino acid permease
MLTSAFSAGNSFLFCSSRILYGLAIREQAPHIMTFCTKKGLPIVAVLCSVRTKSSLFCFITGADGGSKVRLRLLISINYLVRSGHSVQVNSIGFHVDHFAHVIPQLVCATQHNRRFVWLAFD